MKLFQQLLVAPAALGLLAPVAASASDLNIDGVSEYSGSAQQVASISRFSDVHPTDWAYQALNDLAERHGCVAGLPGGKFRGNQAITRYEAASILNECLDRVTEVTDEVRRLVKEFDVELATIRGSVDGIEARVGEMEATQFSTTTKLSGTATWVVGANAFEGDALQSGVSRNRVAEASEDDGSVVFNYDYQLDLDTSFTGEDLFKTKLRAGNFSDSPFGGNGYVGLAQLEAADGSLTDDAVSVARMYYQFPYSDDMTITVGPRVRQDDMLAVWPSTYPADTILDIFTYAGAPGVYNLPTGGGAGVTYNTGKIDFSAGYISTNAHQGDNATGGGLVNEASGGVSTLQGAYTEESWGIALGFAYSQTDEGATNNHTGRLGAGNSTPLVNEIYDMGPTSSYSLSGWWSPDDIFGTEGEWIPNFSWGWGINHTDDHDDSNTTYDSATSQSWYIGMTWDDAFIDGNTFGMAFGQPTMVTDIEYDGTNQVDAVADGNFAWEWWYAVQVSDNITVTPAVFYLSRPFGHQTDTSDIAGESSDNTFSNLGALVKTTFKF